MKSENSIEEFKPRKWLLIVLIVIALAILVVLANKVITEIKKRNAEQKSLFSNITKNSSVSSFNNKYEFYSGIKSCLTASSLLDQVITNNKTNDERKIEVVFEDSTASDPEDIKTIKNKYSTSDKCDISLDYDSAGYVNKITIETTIDAQSFNRDFEFYAGTKYGNQLSYVLDAVIKNNKTNSKYPVTVVFDTIRTSDADEIKNLKKKFDSWTQYEVSVNYNEKGLVYEMVIEK